MSPVARTAAESEEDETVSAMRPVGNRVVRRQDNEEELEAATAARKEVARSVRRQTGPKEKEAEELTPLRRQEEVEAEGPMMLSRLEKEEEENLAALRRQEESEDEVAPLRRQGQEERLTTVRRQQETGEEEASPLRREEQEEEESLSALRRQEMIPLDDAGQTMPPRTQSELEPDGEPVNQELTGEEEPSGLQALHREAQPGPGRPAAGSPFQLEPPGGQSVGDGVAGISETQHPPLAHGPDGSGANIPVSQFIGPNERHTDVVIDQLDVVIHEHPTPMKDRPQRRGHDRAMRARYLRRL